MSVSKDKRNQKQTCKMELCETHEAVGRTVVVVVVVGVSVGISSRVHPLEQGKEREEGGKTIQTRRSETESSFSASGASSGLQEGNLDTRARQNHAASNLQGNRGRTKDQTAALT